ARGGSRAATAIGQRSRCLGGRRPALGGSPMSLARTARRPRRGMILLPAWSVLTLLGGLVISAAASPPPVGASHTPTPSSVTVAGDLQSELGCSGDWQPDC